MPDSSSSPSSSARPPRRLFLFASLGAVVAAGAGGAVAALVRTRPASKPQPSPATPTVLIAALAAEQRLIAAIDSVGDAKALAHLRADHVAHRDALLGAVRLAQSGATVSTPSVTPPSRMTLNQLLAAERAAATAAAAAAASLTGADAALLASISACEASHAELLR